MDALTSVLVALRLLRREAGDVLAPEPPLAQVASGPHREVLRAELRSHLLQSSLMVADAGRGAVSAAWLHSDLRVLQAQGMRSAHLVESWVERVLPSLDGLVDQLQDSGAAFLDVGVGVGVLAIGLCLRFPMLRAVGLDPLEPALMDARAKVKAAGLEGRIELRNGRLEELDDEGDYDLVHVPTMFVPQAALQQGLRRTRIALRSGGWVLLQILAPEGEDLVPAVIRLWCALWGGQSLTLEQTRRELVLAGFGSVQTFPSLSGWPVHHVAGRLLG